MAGGCHVACHSYANWKVVQFGLYLPIYQVQHHHHHHNQPLDLPTFMLRAILEKSERLPESGTQRDSNVGDTVPGA